MHYILHHRLQLAELLLGLFCRKHCTPDLDPYGFESRDSCGSDALQIDEKSLLKSVRRIEVMNSRAFVAHRAASNICFTHRSFRSALTKGPQKQHRTCAKAGRYYRGRVLWMSDDQGLQRSRHRIFGMQDIKYLILLQATIYLYTSMRRHSASPGRLAKLRR